MKRRKTTISQMKKRKWYLKTNQKQQHQKKKQLKKNLPQKLPKTLKRIFDLIEMLI